MKYKVNYKNLNKGITTFIFCSALFLAQLLKGSIVAEFDWFLYVFFSFQVIGSIFQGSISDIYRRSTVLNFSLIIVIFLIILLIFLQGSEGRLLQFLQKGCLSGIALVGNIDVIGRAGNIDIHLNANRRQVMSWTVFFEAFAWVGIGIFMRFFNMRFFEVILFCLFSFIFLLFFSFNFNIDKIEDKELRNPAYEIRMI